MDGLAVTRRLRAKGLRVPILLLTARDAVHERVAGLDAGADDYLVKPFDVDELSARVRAMLRRNAPPRRGALAFADLTLEDRHRAAGRARPRADAARGGAARAAAAQRARRHHARARARGGVGRRGRGDAERRRPLRRLPAPQARRAAADPHRARRRVPARPRVTLRARVAAAAAAAIVLAVALLVIAVPKFLEGELRGTLDDTLVRRAADVARLNATVPGQLTAPGALEGRLAGGTLFVQVVDRAGRIVARSSGLGGRVLEPGAALDAPCATGSRASPTAPRPRAAAGLRGAAGRARAGRGLRRRGRSSPAAGRHRAHARPHPPARRALRAGRRGGGRRAWRRCSPAARCAR